MSKLLVGYARVSTEAQDLTAERDALAALGVESERIYVDHGLTGTNKNRAGRRRGDHNRLGFALQVTTVRFLGVFLENPLDVPWPVVEYVADQIGVGDPFCLKDYTKRQKTAYEHSSEIQKVYGFRSLEDDLPAGEFSSFLRDRAWVHTEGPAAMFDHTVGCLRRHRVLLPGIGALGRQMMKVRSETAERVYRLLAAAAECVDPILPGRLRRLLKVQAGSRFSELELWIQSPTRVSGPALVSALDSAGSLEALRVREADCSMIPPSRISALGRYGMASKAATLQGLAEPRQTGTLLALVRHLDAAAVDDVLDLFALLMSTKLINPARSASNNNRMVSLPRLERASRLLARVNQELLTALDRAASDGVELDVTAVWGSLGRFASREKILEAVTTVTELVPDDDGSVETAMRVALAEKYRTVRLRSSSFETV